MDARQIALILGGRVTGRNRVSVPGPGHGRKDRSLSIKLDPRAPEGFVAYSHAGDDWIECRDHVRERLGLPQWEPGDDQDRRVPSFKIKQFDHAAVNAEVNEGASAWTQDEIQRINQARNVWREAKDPHNTLAEIYLKQYRKLELSKDLAGAVLRFHPACPWRCENAGETIKVPALIAAFRSIDDNIITGIQRIRIDADGRKVDRRMLGIVNNAAIKLDTPDNGTLVIGEGVETCLAGRQLGFKPAWALGSAGSLSRFPVIDGIKQLTLLGENDAASAGAVEICNERWQSAGRTVSIVLPDACHGDLNDELMAVAP
jgi:putative DNA primase/helicase